jgi:hypothetical protein
LPSPRDGTALSERRAKTPTGQRRYKTNEKRQRASNSPPFALSWGELLAGLIAMKVAPVVPDVFLVVMDVTLIVAHFL